jgi:Ca-activated chloride channel family protein
VSFESPLALLGLLALPLLIALRVVAERRRRADAARFSNPNLLPNMAARVPAIRRHLPLALALAALGALVFGVARPRATITVRAEEATVILAIDTSQSMQANDVAPTRLQAARQAAAAFLEKVPAKFRVGIVAFGTRATVALPPTTDRQLALTALADLRPGQGTALGDAILLATRLGGNQRGSSGADLPTSVLVISDGANEGGTTTPQAAAQKARAAHIPVTTVVVGTGDGQIERTLTGGYRELVRVPASPDTLRQVARTSGGEFFTATSDTRLEDVYKRLGSRLGHRRESRQMSDVFGGVSALLLLAGGTLSALWFRRMPVP